MRSQEGVDPQDAAAARRRHVLGASVLWITGVAALLTLMGSSLKNTVQVYFVPMATSLGESRGEFAITTTLFAITYAIASPVVGTLSDRIGPAAVLRIGIGISGATFLAMSSFGNAAVFTVVYGVAGAFGYAALAYVPIGVLVDRVFPPERKGFFYALLTNGTAVGFIVLVPLWIWLGDLLAWQSVLAGLGFVFLLILFPLSLTLRVGAPPTRPRRLRQRLPVRLRRRGHCCEVPLSVSLWRSSPAASRWRSWMFTSSPTCTTTACPAEPHHRRWSCSA